MDLEIVFVHRKIRLLVLVYRHLNRILLFRLRIEQQIYMEALFLSVTCEHSLPLSVVPVLVDLAKECSRDSKALETPELFLFQRDLILDIYL